jgi:hypothetical protein
MGSRTGYGKDWSEVMVLLRGDQLPIAVQDEARHAYIYRKSTPDYRDDTYWLMTHKFYMADNKGRPRLAHNRRYCEPVLGEELEKIKARYVLARVTGGVDGVEPTLWVIDSLRAFTNDRVGV